MKKSTKRRIAVALILMLAGFAGTQVLARRHAKAMMYFADGGDRTVPPESLGFFEKIRVLLVGVNVPRPAAGGDHETLLPGSKRMKIKTTGGNSLEVWYQDQGRATPLVILFHGYAAEKTSLLPEAQALLQLGASVLLVDFRGSGGSSASYTTLGVHEADDVEAVFRFAQNQFSHSRIVLFGQSMGAAAILRAVSSHGIEPDAVIIEAVFDTMLNTVRNRFQAMRVPAFPGAELLVFQGGRLWGFDGFQHQPVSDAASLRAPALFMHGRYDFRATLEEGRRVYDAVPGEKTFLTFDQAGHESYLRANPGKWKSAVGSFLQQL